MSSRAGSGSYSTTMAARAAASDSRSSAATRATASPTWRTSPAGQHGPVVLDHRDEVAAGDVGGGEDGVHARDRARGGHVEAA